MSKVPRIQGTKCSPTCPWSLLCSSWRWPGGMQVTSCRHESPRRARKSSRERLHQNGKWETSFLAISNEMKFQKTVENQLEFQLELLFKKKEWFTCPSTTNTMYTAVELPTFPLNDFNPIPIFTRKTPHLFTGAGLIRRSHATTTMKLHAPGEKNASQWKDGWDGIWYIKHETGRFFLGSRNNK